MRRDAVLLLQQQRRILLGANPWLSSARPAHHCASRRSLSRCRGVRATLSATSTRAAATGKRQRSLPYVVYSQNKREVTAMDVALLLAASKEHTLLDSGSVQKTSYFYHWSPATLQGAAGERVLQKLTRALDRSIAVVAAFTNCDVYEGAGLAQPSGATGRGAVGDGDGGSGSASSSMDGGPISWNWLRSSGSSRAQRKRSLVGFVRAAGDGSLAATIYDLAVHPDFRGCGVGTKLLRVLTQQLYFKEVYDIGSVVPAEAQPFFTRCGFEEDREQSTTLTFTAQHEWREQGLVPGLLPGPAWMLDPQWSGPATSSGGGGGSSTILHSPRVEGAAESGANCRASEQQGERQGEQQQHRALVLRPQPHDAAGQERSTTAREASPAAAGEGAGQSWLAMEGGVGGMGGGSGDGVAAQPQAWGLPGRNDRLARVPCPATEALQSSAELKQLMEHKMEQALARAASRAGNGKRRPR